MLQMKTLLAMRFSLCVGSLWLLSNAVEPAVAEENAGEHIVVVGDPQLRTDHPWFPGELSCSTFDRLFATQAALYERVTGRTVQTDEDKAIASWYWRNLNFYHNYSPRELIKSSEWKPENQDDEAVVREYWSGLFSYGFSLCGNTHSQYTAEMQQLLGHCRARAVGVPGHTTFEVFLKDPSYGADGDWALLDQDVSAIVFQESEHGERLANLWQITFASPHPEKTPHSFEELETLLDNSDAPNGNRGWFKAGLYFPKENSDATGSDTIGCYTDIYSVAPLSGYSSAPPMVALRRNETFRRYFQPGLGDETYVFWGANMNKRGIPGPSRDRTWACEPERMYRATQDTETKTIARYGNAVFAYRPNFSDGSYRDAIVAEDEQSVTFHFESPYAVAATPPESHSQEQWGTFAEGCTNGLILTAENADFTVQFSSDHGHTWSDPQAMSGQASIDWTDLAKSRHAYQVRLNAAAESLTGAGFSIRAVCMANDRLMPHLKSGGTRIQYNASGRAVFSVGPNVEQAERFITQGAIGQDHVEMTMPVPSASREVVEIYAAAQVFSRSPPNEEVVYQIEVSFDQGSTWTPIVKDWHIESHGYQIDDYLARTFCYGKLSLPNTDSPAQGKLSEVMVRFQNDGGVPYLHIEAHLVYATGSAAPVRVTYGWVEGNSGDEKTASHVFASDQVFAAGTGQRNSEWKNVPTGENVQTRWVEMKLAD